MSQDNLITKNRKRKLKEMEEDPFKMRDYANWRIKFSSIATDCPSCKDSSCLYPVTDDYSTCFWCDYNHGIDCPKCGKVNGLEVETFYGLNGSNSLKKCISCNYRESNTCLLDVDKAAWDGQVKLEEGDTQSKHIGNAQLESKYNRTQFKANGKKDAVFIKFKSSLTRVHDRLDIVGRYNDLSGLCLNYFSSYRNALPVKEAKEEDEDEMKMIESPTQLSIKEKFKNRKTNTIYKMDIVALACVYWAWITLSKTTKELRSIDIEDMVMRCMNGSKNDINSLKNYIEKIRLANGLKSPPRFYFIRKLLDKYIANLPQSLHPVQFNPLNSELERLDRQFLLTKKQLSEEYEHYHSVNPNPEEPFKYKLIEMKNEHIAAGIIFQAWKLITIKKDNRKHKLFNSHSIAKICNLSVSSISLNKMFTKFNGIPELNIDNDNK